MKKSTEQGSNEAPFDLPNPENLPGLLPDNKEISPEAFASAFGEPIREALDLTTWSAGIDLAKVFEQLEAEVAGAVATESELAKQIRKQIFPTLNKRSGAPKDAGVYRASIEDLKEVQKHILFNGGVEACDGSSLVHTTLPLTILQISVSLVSYSGNHGAWSHRLYRRDLRMKGLETVDDLIKILESRASRSNAGIAELSRRGIMTCAERTVLADKATAPWRMGHGNPAPYEILTGSGNMGILDRGLEVLERLLLGHKKFIFIPSEIAAQEVMTIADALEPLEYMILQSEFDRMKPIVEDGNLRSPWRERAIDFYNTAGPQLVLGAYRVANEVPARVFYAHRDHAHEAALIAMADSIIQAARGFPVLVDLADQACRNIFGNEGFKSSIQATYAQKGAGLKYLGERETRG